MMKDMQALVKPTEKNTKKLALFVALALNFGLIGSLGAFAQSPPLAKPAAKAKPKSKINTNIYEKEDDAVSFTDEVDIMRDMGGDQQVKFKKHPGFYRIPEGNTKIQSRLVKAKKNNIAITVTADSESMTLQDVTLDGI